MDDLLLRCIAGEDFGEGVLDGAAGRLHLVEGGLEVALLHASDGPGNLRVAAGRVERFDGVLMCSKEVATVEVSRLSL